jgi:exportin-1
VDHFLNGLFSLNRDFLAFKNHTRDFLIQLKEFAGDELFLEEKEAEAERLKKEAFEAALKIPGMVKPHDRPDDGMMD